MIIIIIIIIIAIIINKEIKQLHKQNQIKTANQKKNKRY